VEVNEQHQVKIRNRSAALKTCIIIIVVVVVVVVVIIMTTMMMILIGLEKVSEKL
jgi:flagellar basal body-associated protein FliL